MKICKEQILEYVIQIDDQFSFLEMNIYFADLIQTDQDQELCIFMTESDITHIKNAFAISDKNLDSMIKKVDVSDH